MIGVQNVRPYLLRYFLGPVDTTSKIRCHRKSTSLGHNFLFCTTTNERNGSNIFWGDFFYTYCDCVLCSNSHAWRTAPSKTTRCLFVLYCSAFCCQQFTLHTNNRLSGVYCIISRECYFTFTAQLLIILNTLYISITAFS